MVMQQASDAQAPACSRQGSAVLGTVIEGPDAWYAKDYVGTERHIYRLTPDDIAELDAAVAAVQVAGIEIKVRI